MTTTCVSAYFPVKNKHNNKYLEWFKNTLIIECPYVFFTNKDTIDVIKQYRGDLPTHYIICELSDFQTYRYKDRMITHPTHCPSIEVNLIWNEKLFMVKHASKLNPFNSEWFIWVDAGINVFRTTPPPMRQFPNPALMNTLPKDKFIYSSSNPYSNKKVSRTSYYHHISGTYVLHKTIIDTVVETYRKYLEELIDKHNIWTDQVILTHIYKDHPDLFYKLCDGYGEIIRYLFRNTEGSL